MYLKFEMLLTLLRLPQYHLYLKFLKFVMLLKLPQLPKNHLYLMFR
jgi:hypothetical protein